MTLITFNHPSKGLQRRPMMPSVENLFSSFFGSDLMPRDFALHMPSVNISESEKLYNIEVSAPGFNKEDFSIEVEEGVLTLKGEHKEENKTEEKNFVRKEFNAGSFTRRFNLTELVDEDRIDAKYENGILKIELPKKEEVKAKSLKNIPIA